MQFGSPGAAWFFWIAFGLAIFYIWAFAQKAKVIEQFVQKNLLPLVGGSLSVKKFWLKAAILLLACFLFALALMRPQWGHKTEQVKRKGVDIFIALDTSKSMLAEDIKPNRLERSKLAVSDLLKSLQGDRVGLMAFAGSAFIQCPLTNDYSGFLLALGDIGVNTIPKGGTSISSAIKESIRGFEGGAKKYRVLIIISDGEDHEGDAQQAAKDAANEGVKIHCIGIGNPEGELITMTDRQGSKGFLKDRDGRVIKSRLNEALLQKAALATGGSYVRAGAGEFGLSLLYNERISKMEKRELQTKLKRRYYERYQLPLLLALILLALEPFLAERRGQLI